MITVLGSHNTEEYKAAQHLRHLIVAAWPHADERESHDVTIIAGAKCYGQKAVDIDLVVLIHLARPHRAGTYNDEPLAVRSLCLTIELKNHPQEAIQFEGNRVRVKYRNQENWHDATEQSRNQMSALRGYLEANSIARPPYVVNLIWLYQVPERDLPPVTHNIIGSDATWQTIVERVSNNQHPVSSPERSGYELRASRDIDADYIERALAILTEPLEQTPLDRRKIEAITRKVLQDQAYVEKLINQEQLLIFRGRGGTGKTVRLLQIAHQLYQEQDARVHILTYNRALVADITRLLDLMGIKQGLEQRRIRIQTVHAFVYRVLCYLHIITSDSTDFLVNYEEYKREAMEMLRGGALGKDDLHTMIREVPADFNYDYLMIDEAQDWPADERDLLFAMYDYRQCVLAHGYDQLVRGQQETDWRADIPRNQSQMVPLRNSLRLKAGLCGIVNTIAEELGLTDWDVKPNPMVYGGRVVIVEGDYRQTLHANLLNKHTENGNKPIDMLFCVPPSLAAKQDGGFARELFEWGYQVWDGTDQGIRQTPPTSVGQFRIVQYDSCRGLEGWTAVHLGFDELYDYKVQEYAPTDEEARTMFFDPDQAAHLYALRWLMIPLTRAIDTLVIQIASAEHRVGQALWAAAQHHRELVDWV